MFSRDGEIDKAKSQLLLGNWVIISGQRDIGKTSLMKVVINELKREKRSKGIYLKFKGCLLRNV